jgi:hypothetical protein
MTDPVEIDAEYMNRWLGENTRITSLSPKTLYDIQTLIEYYRDIIVPGVDVSIAFPVGDKDSPRASVERGEVIIPFHILSEGRVDDTIGAMIHELHHIKLSASEVFLHTLSFKFLRALMEQIDCYGLTLAERVFSDSSLTVEKILSDDEKVGNDVSFLRKVLGDMLFLINAVEDVRIDSNTPPNLKKYIDKSDRIHGVRLKEFIEEGNLTNDNRDLTSLAYMLLCHHKGIHEFEFVDEKYGDTNAIVSANPVEYPVELFTAFADEIANHVLGEYYKFCGKPREATNSGGSPSDEFDIDSYFGGKVNSSVGDSLEEQFNNMKAPKHQKSKQEAEKKALKDSNEKIKNVTVSVGDSGAGKPNTKTKIDLSGNRHKKGTTTTDNSPTSAEELRAALEEKSKTVFISPEVNQQIKSFKDVQVYTTTEYFDDLPVVYDAVIYDAIN